MARMRHRRIWIGVGIAVLVLGGLVALDVRLRSLPEDPLEGFEVDAPELTIPGTRAWERAPVVDVVVVRGGRAKRRRLDARTGVGRMVRSLGGEEEDERPVLVLSADAAEPWVSVLEQGLSERVYGTVWNLSGMFLAARGGVVPLVAEIPYVDPNYRYMISLGDIVHTRGVEQRVVRVTRRGERVRYRWWAEKVDERWGAGEVTLDAADVSAGRTKALEPLGALLRQASGRLLVVRLEADADATFVDVLRAVEYADGVEGRQIWTCPWGLSFGSLENLLEIEPIVPDGGGLLEEPLFGAANDGPLWVHILPREQLRGVRTWPPPLPVDDASEIIVMRQELSRDEAVRRIVEERPPHVHLRADTHVRWRDCRPIALAAQRCSRLRASFKAEAGLPHEAGRLLDLPVASGPRTPVKLVVKDKDGLIVDTRPPDLEGLRGKVVVLRVPDEARAGAVLNVALALRASGAVVVFE